MSIVFTDQRPRAARTKADVDSTSLAHDLRESVDGEVRFDDGSRALYARDAGNYRQTPIGVVVPRSVEDIVQAVAVCRSHDAPVLTRGAGTSLAGQSCNVAVVIDTSKYLRGISDLDPSRRQAWVEPGVRLDDLRSAAEQHGLTFGPDPATHAWCTVGGMIGNNSCGVHSVMAGCTADNVEELEVLTYDGVRLHVGLTGEQELRHISQGGGRQAEIYRRLGELRDRYADTIRARFPVLPRRVSGFALDQLLPENGFNVARALVGTEGTCVTVLGARLRLVDSPPARALLLLGYEDVYSAADHVPAVLELGPIGLEGMDDRLVGYMERKGLHSESLGLLPEGDGWLLAEFGGRDEAEAEQAARAAMEHLRQGTAAAPSMKLYMDVAERDRVWEVRESGLGATAFVPGMDDTWPGWEDSAVPPEALGDYLRDLRRLLERFEYRGSFYGHFGQGCLHTRIDFEFGTDAGVRRYRDFIEQAADLVISHGGSLSGEHGDGQARAELLGRMYGDEVVGAFREFKSIWDPDDGMNPGKVVDPHPIDRDLALRAPIRPLEEDAHFRYPDDEGSFARATLRCVGVGKCRDTESGTMCPSYQVLREEKHTTRGRAHLLHEMLVGETIQDGWRSEEVKEALDLCLGCKGCKGDCPVDVDVATYKAEFMSHYYAGRLRPRAAYAFGLIFYWARLASLAPDLVNAVSRAPVLNRLAKAAAGVAPQRAIPSFAPETFRSWFRRRAPRDEARPPVVLWTDTFTDHLQPSVAKSAVAVLEAAGRRVVLPEQWACCGRPVYDFGMLDLGKRLLRNSIEVLRPHIAAGTPIVGLEPSCVSVFRDELRSIYPDDDEASRLSRQVLTLGEFLRREGYGAALGGRAIMQGHCHQKAIMGIGHEMQLMLDAGMDVDALDSGCCGMAGPFGFEAGEHYEVSIGAGERVLLPAVRAADAQTYIIADGFSCREQISQQTQRRALHLAQVLHLAMASGRLDGRTPEAAYDELIAAQPEWKPKPPVSQPLIALGLGAATAAALGAAASLWRQARRAA